MTCLVTADLHLNLNRHDEYRWGILKWLEITGKTRNVDFIMIAGDLTDAKDEHPSQLVNRLADFFAGSENQWVIISGNHDYNDPDWPFFEFLKHQENIRWIKKGRIMKLPVREEPESCLLLPATKAWEEEWPKFFEGNNRVFPFIFLHGMFQGTYGENGFKIPGGIPVNFFDRGRYGEIYAGDIHTPGTVTRRIERIGAPYRVKFGDIYQPRVLLFRKHGAPMELFPETQSRHVLNIRGLDDLDSFKDVRSGDQVKVRVTLRRRDYPEWPKLKHGIREKVTENGWVLRGIELDKLVTRVTLDDKPEQRPKPKHISFEMRVAEYAAKRKLSDVETQFGLDIVHGVIP